MFGQDAQVERPDGGDEGGDRPLGAAAAIAPRQPGDQAMAERVLIERRDDQVGLRLLQLMGRLDQLGGVVRGTGDPGLRQPVEYSDVMRLLPALRPYPRPRSRDYRDGVKGSRRNAARPFLLVKLEI